MPNGVICGGAVDGSNQAGAMVTCHAIVARPDGTSAAKAADITLNPAAAISPRTARRIHEARNGGMVSLPT